MRANPPAQPDVLNQGGAPVPGVSAHRPSFPERSSTQEGQRPLSWFTDVTVVNVSGAQPGPRFLHLIDNKVKTPAGKHPPSCQGSRSQSPPGANYRQLREAFIVHK